MTNRPDAGLVEALRAGDAGVFEELVRELDPALLHLARAHVPSQSVAEEVVGDTWIAVIEGIDGFEGRSSLRTWIFQIVLNKARTRGRREARTRGIACVTTGADGARAGVGSAAESEFVERRVLVLLACACVATARWVSLRSTHPTNRQVVRATERISSRIVVAQ